MAKEKFEINKILVVSTAHLPQAEAEKLTAKGLEVFQSTYGYILWCYDADNMMPGVDPDYSVEILNLMRLAREKDCTWIHFDRDGPTLTDFPVFDW